jgi:acyl transferase domain-containing protein/NADPH:quinone reductase-like Zn-dependent oxidoreductase/NADP-dependent 3-hydroxy acid dehydrogenase YdfG/aryl carrier-like protein
MEHQPIAIVGIGCRFPGGCNDPVTFWRFLLNRGDAITEVPPDRWDLNRFFDPNPATPGTTYSRWGGFIEGLDQFDAAFFGISPREAVCMDPQQRLLLEVAYEALEDAGQPLGPLAGSNTAVCVGISSYDYGASQTTPTERIRLGPYSSTGSALSIAANRISCCFDFLGPSVAVDTACSSSLTAVHLACQSIWHQGCLLALAGGVNALISADGYVGFSRLGILSPDGRCKAFDARANGYVRGEGAGIVVLKPLALARADGDRIYALIGATAANQDGRSTGLTVPNQIAQEALLREACRRAGLAPHRIQYVEAHGTGTPVGDPIEARALGAVLAAGRPAGSDCVIGSVKTNIGHLEAGSGAPGLIKTALALFHRMIAPNLHFQSPNPDIPFEQLRLRVAREAEPWPAPLGEAVAGINSFGFGGSNAHVILREATFESGTRNGTVRHQDDGETREGRALPPPTPRDSVTLDSVSADAGESPGSPVVFPFTARGTRAMQDVARSFERFLRDEGAALQLSDLLYNLAHRRTHHDHRLGVVARTRDELRDGLRAAAEGAAHPAVILGRAAPGAPPSLLWVFCGQGPQWWGMGRQLLQREPVFRETVRRCDDLICRLGGWSLLAEFTAEPERSRIGETAVAQPAIFTLQVALAALWRSWGILPDAVVGHSVGEVAAAHVAGALSLEDATRVIFHRGRCMGFATGAGKMLAVALSPEEAAAAVAPHDGRVGVAALNGPGSVTLAGEAEPLEEIARDLDARQVFNRFLVVPHAFHSAQMDPARDPLLEALADIRPQPARIPMFSTVSGERADGRELGAEYWWQNVRLPVRFAGAVEKAADAGFHLVLEVGPHPVLGGSIREGFQKRGVKGEVLPSLRRGEDEPAVVRRTLAGLWAAGRPVRWQAFAPSGPVVRLPGYPWQHESYWSEAEELRELRLQRDSHPLLGRSLRGPVPAWEACVGTGPLPYLRDHCLQDHPLFPATGYLEVALAAARAISPDATPVVEEVRFVKACFLEDGRRYDMRTVYQPGDSSFQIHTRPVGEGAGWTANAAGFLRPRSLGPPPRLDLDAVRARCPDEVDAEVCYAGFREVGLGYGPAFRGICRLWRGPGEALAQVQLPAALEGTGTAYRYHPALLDACIQALFAVVPPPADPDRREVFLPVEVAEVRGHGVPGTRLWSHARLVEKTRLGVVTDVSVCDEAGALVWEARRLVCQLAGLEGGAGSGPLDGLVYEQSWQFRPRRGWALPAGRGDGPPPPRRSADHLRPPSEVAAQVRAVAARLRAADRLEDLNDRFQRAVGPLCAAYAWAALRELGGPDTLPATFTAEDLGDRLSVAPQHRRLLDRFLRWFEEDGVLHRGEGRWERIDSARASSSAYPDPARAWREVMTRQPACFAEIMLIGRCGRGLAGVLRGDTDPLHLIFPDGSLAAAEHLYQDAPLRRYYNDVARDAAARTAAGLPAGRALRVLEVGAGTGALTASVLPVLPSDRTEFVYTDLSQHFLSYAQTKFRDCPFMAYQRLDVERDPVRQGFAPHSFDLILASRVLHATTDLRRTLGHVLQLLASGGILLLIESVRPTREADLVFGLTEGWWQFTDLDVRPDHVMIPFRRWERLLEEEGFSQVHDVTDSDTTSLDSAVVMARGPTLALADGRAAVGRTEQAADPGRWLLLADRRGVGGELARRLQARGHDCALRFADHPDAVRELVEEAGRAGPPRGLVYLGGHDAPDAGGLDAAGLMAAQASAAQPLIRLVQAGNEAVGPAARLYVATRRAFAAGPGEPGGAGAAGGVDLTQAPLLGLARVILNEFPKLRCTLVDLAGTDPDAEMHSLVEELESSDDEDEVALCGEVRLVPRYAVAPQAAAGRGGSPAAAREGEAYRLGLDRSNTIDGLTLKAVPRTPPGPGEVEIRVRAAGLNFSDVLKALGLYPGLPDGPVPLGIECSGEVTAVGEGAARLRVGDGVLTVAPFTFSSHLTVPADQVVRKPDDLSHEEAATIPIAFLTAHYALNHLGRMQPGESVLVHSATGGVGLAAIQLIRAAGGEVLATAGSPEKRQLLRALGVAWVMDSRSLAFADEVMEHTHGRGVDLVLNSLSGEALAKSFALLADHGRFLEIGKRDIYQNSRLGMAPFRKNVSFLAIDLDRVMRRSPGLVAGLLGELAEKFRSGVLSPLPFRSFPVSNAAGAFRFMAQGKHTGKLVLRMTDPHLGRAGGLPAPAAARVAAHGTYLLTGGLGGFGLAVAEWLVERGARHLVLIGRSGASTPEAEAVVERLRGRSAQVMVARADVADPGQVADVLAGAARALPPLRGVIHAAMVLDDCSLLNLTPQRWHQVQRPKVAGAWNLHLQTRHLPLDLFVCFSSMSSVFGIAGQANYAAANAFLDALAHYRRADGLPALTVNWGYLAEVGYVARNEKVGQRFESWGFLGVTPRQALGALAHLLGRDTPQAAVMKLDWHRFHPPGLSDALSPRFARLASGARADAGAGGADVGSVCRRLMSLDGDERKAMLQGLLREKIARVLGASAAQLDGQRPLNELGLDSIMGVELRNWIADELRVDLPTVQLVRGPSIDHLTELLLAQLGGPPPGPQRGESRGQEDGSGGRGSEAGGNEARRPVGVRSEDGHADDLAASVAGLSNEEVDDILKAMGAGRESRA